MISSQSAVSADPYGGPYNMAKAAQESLAFTLAKEEARSGIRVNVVVPGLRTPTWADGWSRRR